MRELSVLLLLICSLLTRAQQPSDSDSICEIPIYTGGYESSGLNEGTVAEDFTLYGLDGAPFHLAEVLEEGKPVLLVGGSYTCPVFRNKISTINEIWQNYQDRVQVAVVYSVEAHPEIDISPYSGSVWTTQANEDEGVLYPQARSYGERKVTASTMVDSTGLLAPVILDLPCNDWWLKYGPAPQNAYLIRTNGVIFSKHGWFDRSPNDIYCDLDSLLDGTSCGTTGNSGVFSWDMLEPDTVYGSASEVLTIKGELTNESATDQVVIGVYRLTQNLPQGWESAMCVDICLDTEVDTTFVIIEPGEKQLFTIYFYTNQTPGLGAVRIGFRNEVRSNNQQAQYFYASNIPQTSLLEQEDKRVKLYPNPANGLINIQVPEEFLGNTVEFLDLSGRLLWESTLWSQNQQWPTPVSEGVYLLRIIDSQRGNITRKVITTK